MDNFAVAAACQSADIDRSHSGCNRGLPVGRHSSSVDDPLIVVDFEAMLWKDCDRNTLGCVDSRFLSMVIGKNKNKLNACAIFVHDCARPYCLTV